MKLDESGEGFFVEETSGDEEYPPLIVTSPISTERPDGFADSQLSFRDKASNEGATSRKQPDFETKILIVADIDVLLPSELDTYDFDKKLKPSLVSDAVESGKVSPSAGIRIVP